MSELEKYIVIPTKYLHILSKDQRHVLADIADHISSARLRSNRDQNPEYLVCKTTEPYAEIVWGLIKHDSEVDNDSIDEQMAKAHQIDLFEDSIDEQMAKANKFDINS